MNQTVQTPAQPTSGFGLLGEALPTRTTRRAMLAARWVMLMLAAALTACGGGGGPAGTASPVSSPASSPASPPVAPPQVLAVDLVGDATLDAEVSDLVQLMPDVRLGLHAVRTTAAEQLAAGLPSLTPGDQHVVVLSFGTFQPAGQAPALATALTALVQAAQASGARVVIEGPLRAQPWSQIDTTAADGAAHAVADATGAVFCSRQRALSQADQPDGINPSAAAVRINAVLLADCIRRSL